MIPEPDLATSIMLDIKAPILKTKDILVSRDYLLGLRDAVCRGESAVKAAFFGATHSASRQTDDLAIVREVRAKLDDALSRPCDQSM